MIPLCSSPSNGLPPVYQLLDEYIDEGKVYDLVFADNVLVGIGAPPSISRLLMDFFEAGHNVRRVRDQQYLPTTQYLEHCPYYKEWEYEDSGEDANADPN